MMNEEEMTNFDRVAAWHKACSKEPGNASHLSVGLGVHIEELAEQLECMRVDSDGWQRVLDRAVTDLSDLAKEIKSGKRMAHVPHHLREGFLKELCDGDVTGNAVAFLSGFNKNEADKRVLASNDAKLVDGKPVIQPGGKIGRPDGWQKPDLRGLV